MYKWLNYDLHMHSEYSRPYDKHRVKTMTAQEFVDNLLNKEIEVFSITDHNCFSSEYNNKIKEYIKDKSIKLIPGCEFNIYVDDESKFQANFYFSLDVDFDSLENSIKGLYENNNKPRFSQIIDTLNKKSFNFIVFPEADKSNGGIRQVWRKIDSLNETDRFHKNGMQRIFRGYDSSDSFNKESADTWALSYYKTTTEFDEKISKYSLDEITKITENVNNRIKSKSYNHKELADISNELYDIITNYGGCFSYFHFSDWHNAEAYEPKHKNFVFGNPDLPYESLELATLDPKSRIIIDDKTLVDNPIGYLKQLSFKMNGKVYTIDFERGLNAIIGERASGKSLLMAIILKLANKNNGKLNEYKSYKIADEDIEGTTFDGNKINVGQLNSLGYIEQNTISEIFNNPEKYSETETIKKNYEALDEVNTNGFDRIVDILKQLKQYNSNYKSITSYLVNHKRLNVFAYKKLEKIETTKLNSDYTNFKNSADAIISDIEKIGLSSGNLKKIYDDFKRELLKVDQKIKQYNKLIEFIDARIDGINNDNANALRTIQAAINDYDSAKKIIFDNFDNLLLFKKAENLINNFKIDEPSIKLNRKGKFLFLSACQVANNLSDTIKDELANSFNLRGNKDVADGIDALRKYLNGAVLLKANYSTFYSNLEKKFIMSNIKSIYNLYEIKSELNIDTISSLSEINNLVGNNQLEDIKSSSLGRKSIAYLEIMLEDSSSILLFDQPEDNIDNHYISNNLVPIIKEKKKVKQLIFITHNPSIAVYADAFNYIFATNNNNNIEYTNYFIEKQQDKDKILDILDGGSPSFSNRNLKYGNIIGEYKYAIASKKR